MLDLTLSLKYNYIITTQINLMNCPNCNSLPKKHGKDRHGNQRFRCLACGKTFTETERLENRNLPVEKILLVINMLVEGSSIRSIERITGVHRDTVISLLKTVGERCDNLMQEKFRNLKVKDVQADEIWSFRLPRLEICMPRKVGVCRFRRIWFLFRLVVPMNWRTNSLSTVCRETAH